MSKRKNWGLKIDKLLSSIKTWQFLVLFLIVGFAVFFSGLSSPFQNDDFTQIVSNTPVHSISNIPSFFGSSTFFNGEKLTGVYYRPLMTTTFSIIYSIFGAQPVAYHLVQLILYIFGAFILFLVFKHFFKLIFALPLAIIFLVHPMNSQVVYSIPTMQDALFFFFGILAIFTLIKYRTNRGMWVAILFFLMSLFSKESGILFVILGFLYLYLFDKERIRIFLSYAVLPVFLYFVFKINTVGLVGANHAAPINELSLIGRIFTAPSIALFYFTKFIFPSQLSLGYYWVHPTFSIGTFLMPLVVDLLVVGLFIYLGMWVRKKLSKEKFNAFIFFAIWAVIGLGLYMQIIPGLDFTACEAWFYFTMAGILGMIGIALLSVEIHFHPEWLVWLGIVATVSVIVLLGVHSNLRGYDYKSQYNLAVHDLTVSPDDFAAMNNIAQYLEDNSKSQEAIKYAQQSINIYPIVSNYNNLGVALQQTGDYKGAIIAYNQALKYGNMGIIYENLALTHIVYSKPIATNQFFKKALKEYPHDFKLWLYYAVFEGAIGSNADAVNAITTAASYGKVPSVIYNGIMQNKPFGVPILGKTLLVR
jgi:hypothetical protein